MMLLPSLIFGSEIEGSRVLEVWWQYNCFVASFTGKLNSEVPGIEGNEGEVEVLGGQMFGCKCIKSVDCIAEGPCIANMLPSESCQAR